MSCSKPGPSFGRQSSSLRTYSKANKKSTQAVKKPEPPAVKLLVDDTLNMSDIAKIERIEALHVSNKKRKSDEVLQPKPEFKSPGNPVKKPKKSTDRPLIQEDLYTSLLNNAYTQQFLQSCTGTQKQQLTQTTACVNNPIEDQDFTVFHNPKTLSQYLQMKNEAAPEELDDTLQLLFANADTNESGLNKTIGKVEDTQSLAAIDWDTDEEVLTKSSSANLAASSKLKGEPNTSRLNQSDASIKSTSSSNKSALKSSYPRPKLLPVSSGAYTEMGPFFGLTVRTKKFILKTKNIESLYDWQTECLNLRAIHNRDNLIYALPTSGGKTLVAEIAMLREVILRRKNVIFVLPYVSIVQEKIQDLTPFAMEFNFQLEDYCAGKGSIPPTRRRKKSTIYVCTIEKSQILYDSLLENKRLHEIGLIVVDELHMIGDEHRGYSLEILLTKVVYDEKAKIQIIGMSATISNLREVATALRADIYTRDFRPVELTEYVKIGPDILTIDPSSRYLSEAFKVKRSIGDDYTSQMLKRDPDHLSTLVLEIVPKSSVLIFCATKQNCESVATLLCDVMPREMKKFKYEEKVNLIDSIKADSSGRICPILARSIAYGVAYHHSGLTGDERKHLEEGYRLGIISVICCTSTLAAGVNLPAQRVIIRSPYIGPNFLTLTRYKQMVGRAGRAGKCETGESIIIFDPRDHDKLLDLLCSSMDETVSGFVKDESGGLLRTAVLNILTLKLATNIDELIQVMNRSLLRAQIRRLGCTLREKIVKTVKSLVDEGALSFESTTKRKCQRSFTVKTNTEEIDVYPDDNLEVSKLGKAAVNAGISLEDAQKVEQDLIKAGKNLNVIESLHMLYIVAPKDTVESINPDNLLFNDFILRLNPDLMNIAKILGITESLAMRLITRPGSIKSCEKATLKRFYVALMLFDLFSNSRDVYEVAAKYKANRGLVHGLMNSAASRAYGILKFCEMYERFEMFKSILDTFTKRLAYCCSTELLPLMELPAVKIGRAKLIYAAGYKTVLDISELTPNEFVQTVKNLNMKQAEQIITASKHLVKEKIDEFQEIIDELKGK